MCLYALGSNGSGQLGIGNTKDVSTPNICLFPNGPEVPGKLVKIVAGGNHTLVLLDDGVVYCTGIVRDGNDQSSSCETYTSFQQAHISTSGHAKVDLCSAFWEGSVFVHSQNELFTAGYGQKGELGIGQASSLKLNLLHDALPPHLRGQNIVDIASGVGHTVIVLANGQVLGWGNGRKGQLGTPTGIVRSPRQIQNLDFSVVRAVCGREFTYLVGRDGRQSILGSDKYFVKSKLPIVVNPKDIGASWGSVFTLENGSVTSWGRNDRGQLGPPNLPEIDRFAVGSEHAVALTKYGHVICWGWGEHGNCGAQIDKDGNVKETWNEIPIPDSSGRVLGVGAGCATSFFWTES